MATPPFRLCVYCGSRLGTDPRYADAARELGRALGASGGELVYGGGRVGLMGVVADAVLSAGGRVIGVIPEALMAREVGHQGLSELFVVPDMHQRKRRMAEGASAFVALPGGIGTLEELFEVWTWRHLGYHDQPIGLLNVAGYFDPLLAFVRQMVAHDFLASEESRTLHVDDDPGRLLAQLRVAAEAALGRDDFSRV